MTALRSVARLVGPVVLGGALLGCSPANAPIPLGAQLLHVTVVGSEVVLQPTTARAGDIYVILDTPRSSVGFAQAKRSADATPGPLTDEELARLASGDTQGTAIGGFDLLGCSDEQRAEHIGDTGPCGNAFEIRLAPGKYALWTGDLEGQPAAPITVLTVEP
jgi:hypothetical protein